MKIILITLLLSFFSSCNVIEQDSNVSELNCRGNFPLIKTITGNMVQSAAFANGYYFLGASSSVIIYDQNFNLVNSFAAGLTPQRIHVVGDSIYLDTGGNVSVHKINFNNLSIGPVVTSIPKFNNSPIHFYGNHIAMIDSSATLLYFYDYNLNFITSYNLSTGAIAQANFNGSQVATIAGGNIHIYSFSDIHNPIYRGNMAFSSPSQVHLRGHTLYVNNTAGPIEMVKLNIATDWNFYRITSLSNVTFNSFFASHNYLFNINNQIFDLPSMRIHPDPITSVVTGAISFISAANGKLFMTNPTDTLILQMSGCLAR